MRRPKNSLRSSRSIYTVTSIRWNRVEAFNVVIVTVIWRLLIAQSALASERERLHAVRTVSASSCSLPPPPPSSVRPLVRHARARRFNRRQLLGPSWELRDGFRAVATVSPQVVPSAAGRSTAPVRVPSRLDVHAWRLSDRLHGGGGSREPWD
jgi:hypothetical protein